MGHWENTKQQVNMLTILCKYIMSDGNLFGLDQYNYRGRELYAWAGIKVKSDFHHVTLHTVFLDYRTFCRKCLKIFQIISA